MSASLRTAAPLAGTWKAQCFLASETEEKIKCPEGCEDTIKRNETITLVRTRNQYVLRGEYKSGNNQTNRKKETKPFFVLCYRQKQKFVIKSAGEFRVPPSYETTLPKSNNNDTIIWDSQRRNEPPHRIKWKRTQGDSGDVYSGPLPISIANVGVRKRTWTCDCGCGHTGASTEFVQVSKPKPLKKKTTDINSKASTLRRRREAAARVAARKAAHWVPVYSKLRHKEKCRLRISVEHLHPFAQEHFSRGDCPLSTFTLAEDLLEKNVEPQEIRRHFVKVEGTTSLIPMLNFRSAHVQVRSMEAVGTRVKARRRSDSPHEGAKKKIKMAHDENPQRELQVLQAAVAEKIAADAESIVATAPRNKLHDILQSSAPIRQTLSPAYGLQEQLGQARAKLRQCYAVEESLETALKQAHNEIKKAHNEIHRLKAAAAVEATTKVRYRWLFLPKTMQQGEVQCLKYCFGLVDDFSDMVSILKCFFPGLEEEHSEDERSRPLTAFEACLVAKL